MGPRRIARELALQFLFSCDMLGRLNMTEAEAAAAFEAFGRHFAVGMPGSRAALPYARTLASGVCQRLAELDAQIAARSHNWRLERMPMVDRAILRIAAYELRFCDEVPAQVAINEALEIAKRYSIAASVSFINGILDGMQGARPALS